MIAWLAGGTESGKQANPNPGLSQFQFVISFRPNNVLQHHLVILFSNSEWLEFGVSSTEVHANDNTPSGQVYLVPTTASETE